MSLVMQDLVLKQYCDEHLIFFDHKYSVATKDDFFKSITVLDFHKGVRIKFDTLKINDELFIDNGKVYDKISRDDIYTSLNLYNIPMNKRDNLIITDGIFCSARFSKLSDCYQLFKQTGEEKFWRVNICEITVQAGIVIIKEVR